MCRLWTPNRRRLCVLSLLRQGSGQHEPAGRAKRASGRLTGRLARRLMFSRPPRIYEEFCFEGDRVRVRREEPRVLLPTYAQATKSGARATP